MTQPISLKSMTILFDLLHVNDPPTGITSENSQMTLPPDLTPNCDIIP